MSSMPAGGTAESHKPGRDGCLEEGGDRKGREGREREGEGRGGEWRGEEGKGGKGKGGKGKEGGMLKTLAEKRNTMACSER